MIKTQDGMQLINIANVHLVEAFEMCGTHKWGVRAAIAAGYVILGVYDTKERAMEAMSGIYRLQEDYGNAYSMPEK